MRLLIIIGGLVVVGLVALGVRWIMDNITINKKKR
jgi:hypothetical protein